MNSNNEYHDNHYAEMQIQPIEYCQVHQSHEAFVGGLYFNVVKYHKRAGHKVGEPRFKEENKRNRYISWYVYACRGVHIDPRLDYPVTEYEIKRICDEIDKNYENWVF